MLLAGDNLSLKLITERQRGTVLKYSKHCGEGKRLKKYDNWYFLFPEFSVILVMLSQVKF